MLSAIKGMWPCGRGRLWRGLKKSSLDMSSAQSPECRQETSLGGVCPDRGDRECKGAEAGVSLSVGRTTGRVWREWSLPGKVGRDFVKEGFVSWGEKVGFYCNCNGQPFEGVLSRVSHGLTQVLKRFFWVALGQVGLLTFQGFSAWEAPQLLSELPVWLRNKTAALGVGLLILREA